MNYLDYNRGNPIFGGILEEPIGGSITEADKGKTDVVGYRPGQVAERLGLRDVTRAAQGLTVKPSQRTHSKIEETPTAPKVPFYTKTIQRIRTCPPYVWSRLVRCLPRGWLCMFGFLMVGPIVIVLAAEIMATVCQTYITQEAIYGDAECLVTRTHYLSENMSCYCGSCSGRRRTYCYNSYPCLIVTVNYTTYDGRVTGSGTLNGLNTSTKCAIDQLSPCYGEYYLNQYDVTMFEKEYHQGKKFDCHYLKHNKTYVQQDKNILPITLGMITNCFLWPSMMCICCVVWFIIGIIEIVRHRTIISNAKQKASLFSHDHCRHEGGRCRLMSQTMQTASYESSWGMPIERSKYTSSASVVQQSSQLMDVWDRGSSVLGRQVCHSFPKARVGPFNTRNIMILEEEEEGSSGEEGTVLASVSNAYR